MTSPGPMPIRGDDPAGAPSPAGRAPGPSRVRRSGPRFLLLLLAPALLIAACAPSSPAKKQEASARMQMGITYLNQRDIPAAMRELAAASELDPENPEVDMAFGLAYQARGDDDAAERSFREAIGKRPDYAEAHNNLGVLLSRRGRSREAIREFETAASNVLYPTPEVACTNLGEEHKRLGDLERAEAMYRRAIAFNDRYAAPYRGLAAVHGARGQWGEAAKALERSVAVAPEFWAAWLDLGLARVRLGRREEALQAFRAVLAGSADPAVRAKAAEQINALERGRR